MDRKIVSLLKEYDISKLEIVLDILLSGDELPAKYKDHQLRGEFRDFRECHIEPNWLLIYSIDRDEITLIVSRTGTHSDLLE